MDPTRRTMMATGGAALAVAATPQAFGRYPDPAVEVLDPSFTKYRLFNAAVERLATGMRWSGFAGASPSLRERPRLPPCTSAARR